MGNTKKTQREVDVINAEVERPKKLPKLSHFDVPGAGIIDFEAQTPPANVEKSTTNKVPAPAKKTVTSKEPAPKSSTGKRSGLVKLDIGKIATLIANSRKAELAARANNPQGEFSDIGLNHESAIESNKIRNDCGCIKRFYP